MVEMEEIHHDLRHDKKSGVLFSCLVAFVSFVTQALSMGFFVSFGTVYVELINKFNTTESQAAWIGSLAISTCFFFGFFSSLISKRYGCGNIISIGGALLGIGLLLSSIAEDVLMITVTFGGITSIGCSFLYFASLSVLPHYFKEHLCLATSIACCGVSLSGITFSPIMAYLIDEYDFKTCFQLFSITAIIPLVGGFIIQRYGTENRHLEEKDRKNTKLFDLSIINNKKLILVIFAMSLVELCYFIPYVHLVNFAMHNGISLIDASFLPVSLSIGSLIGKILFGFIGQIKGVNILYLFQMILLSMAVCLTLLPMARTITHLIVFSVVYGIFDGAFSGYTVPIVATTVPPAKLSMAFGAMYTLLSVEILFGPPLAGFIYASTSSYQIPFTLCGGIIVSATLLLFFVPYIKDDKQCKKEKVSLLQNVDVTFATQDTNKKCSCTRKWVDVTFTKASKKLFQYGTKLKLLTNSERDIHIPIFNKIKDRKSNQSCNIISSFNDDGVIHNSNNSSSNNNNNNNNCIITVEDTWRATLLSLADNIDNANSSNSNSNANTNISKLHMIKNKSVDVNDSKTKSTKCSSSSNASNTQGLLIEQIPLDKTTIDQFEVNYIPCRDKQKLRRMNKFIDQHTPVNVTSSCIEDTNINRINKDESRINSNTISNSKRVSKCDIVDSCLALKKDAPVKAQSIIELNDRSSLRHTCNTRIIDSHSSQCSSSSIRDQGVKNNRYGTTGKERRRSTVNPMKYLYTVLEYYSLLLSHQRRQPEITNTINNSLINNSPIVRIQSVC